METTIDGMPFSVLMDQAVKLKNAQAAPLRSKFDSYPSFYQNSIFPRTQVVQAREDTKDFEGRLSAAVAFKEAGNAAFRDNDFDGAVLQYEMALSVFTYLENTNPSWRTEGIKDAFIKEVSYECKDPNEKKQIEDLLISCYGNIALVSLKSNDFRVAIDACDGALELDGSCVKAMYLRSQARVAPKSAGAAEHDMALKDLVEASKIDPSNKAVRNALVGLRNAARAQKQADRKTFQGMFDRGSICTDQELSGTKEKDHKRDPTIAEANRVADMFATRGMGKEEEALRESIEQAKSGTQKTINFRRPTEQMIDEARKRQIDLTDERVVSMLEQLQNDRRAGDLIKDNDENGILNHIWKRLQMLPCGKGKFFIGLLAMNIAILCLITSLVEAQNK